MADLSRTDRRRADRQAKKDTRQKTRQKQQSVSMAQKAVVFAIVALFVGGAGFWAYARWKEGSPGQYVTSMGNRHVTPQEIGLTKYNSDPPTSGPHVPQIANWGVHNEAIPKEYLVHNLEDGGVAMQYNCNAAEQSCKDLVDKLTKIALKYDHIVLAPYPGMSNKIALTAWTRIEKFDEFDEPRIARFIEAYIHIDHHPAGGEG
ncbi:MAG TPA: DUF3105 domain-containing protein [Candidatus Binatia bacterium]|jgi:hypothetical protein|nr:DUF3105 domain-containing protein [Candidatus Binatia bacterium]